MPHIIEITGDPPIARVCIEGALDVSYWRWVLYDMLQRTRHSEVALFLVDLRSADLHVDGEELVDVGDAVRRQMTENVRVAALCCAGTASREAEPPAGPGYVHLFTSEPEATSWLRGDAREAAA